MALIFNWLPITLWYLLTALSSSNLQWDISTAVFLIVVIQLF